MEALEIERKFLVKKLPEDLKQYECRQLEQGYLCTEPVVRIRRSDDTYTLTYKGKGLLVREEYNLPLTQEAYEHLKPKADGILITKKRYKIPYRQYMIELDILKENWHLCSLRRWSSHQRKKQKRLRHRSGSVRT